MQQRQCQMRPCLPGPRAHNRQVLYARKGHRTVKHKQQVCDQQANLQRTAKFRTASPSASLCSCHVNTFQDNRPASPFRPSRPDIPARQSGAPANITAPKLCDKPAVLKQQQAHARLPANPCIADTLVSPSPHSGAHPQCNPGLDLTPDAPAAVRAVGASVQRWQAHCPHLCLKRVDLLRGQAACTRTVRVRFTHC